ncbi:hypothetical protein [Anabaena lutea]|uniref:Uncharacterized protein n=1 Tax=Anabaena lutea FACHB-196 TaxID=2692881 RepID=A0ABR8FI37_9NOST|nr:hypothetical protein [Anabaena lutea]MBD2568361.1 hypothetical protein [Anabaena lutea FACHB-196]
MPITWSKIFQASYYNLHTNPRPKIVVIHPFTSRLVAIELSKIGGWDINFVAHLAPFTTLPESPGNNFYTRWRRLYIGYQTLELDAADILGNLEIKPRLWIPDITVRVWEGVGFVG